MSNVTTLPVESARPVDLSSCDIEPIHVIGRIQSFGWLISCSSDWIVNHLSLNCVELFGRTADQLIGLPAYDLLAQQALHEIRSRLQMLGSPDLVERIFDVDLIGNGRLFDIAVHASGRNFIIEAEPAEPGKRRDYVAYVRPMIERIRKPNGIQKLCEAAARQLRGLTGFNRVMIYRFDDSGAGEVIAESLAGQVDSFRGLRFPASDIPAQARRLYARNVLRIITDVDDPTVPIVPALNPNGEPLDLPLDLSMSGLRAVSPIHIQYLTNMGVRASMSISIMRRDKLWGLVTCHHFSPLRLSYSLRTAAELFGEFFAFVLEQAESDAASERHARSLKIHDQFMARLAGGESLLAAFEDFAETIASVVPFDGIIGWVDGEFMAQGDTPDRMQFAELLPFLNTTGASTVWSTDNLSSVFAPAAAYVERSAGLLALPVSRTPRDYIVLFRREYVHEVNWAGDPRKPAENGPVGKPLTPRKSFEIWKEERRAQSRPWLVDEIATAEALRITLLEVVLRLADKAHHALEQAEARQDILIAELNHRVRNILNLIRGLVTQSRAGVETVDDFAQVLGDRIHALARAHDQATRTNWAPASFQELVLAECKAYVADSLTRLSISGTDALIRPGAFATMALVIHELMTNSCKYGALSAASGSVAITLARTADGGLDIGWRESGGPIVTPPKRRGFGSAIIERTIPHELSGEAKVLYQPTGVIARFVLPPEQVAGFWALPSFEQANGPRPMSGSGTLGERLSGHALLVEDNMIIAMEAEDILLAMGCEQVHVVSSVADALFVLERQPIAFAMLDVNLGRETSAAVAEDLVVRGVPFIFASGYGEASGMPDHLLSLPVVTKPYSHGDVAAAIARLG